MADTRLIDPLGRTVVLHGHTWFGHVIKQHPDMRPYRRLAEAAVRDPLEIRLSDADPNSRFYYGTGPRAGMMVAVVVDISRRLVRTAHLSTEARGVIEWSKPTP